MVLFKTETGISETAKRDPIVEPTAGGSQYYIIYEMGSKVTKMLNKLNLRLTKRI